MNAVAINPLQNFKIRFQNFFPLCKPRVSALIVFTAIIGMFLATPNMVPLDILVAATVGIGLASGAAAAFNCLIEQEIDARMARTRGRPLPTGQVSSKETFIFASIIGTIGLGILYVFVNPLTMWLTLFTLRNQVGRERKIMPTPTYDLIASNVLSSSASSVTFSSIPATYRDLVLVVDGTGSSATQFVSLRFNGSFASEYTNVTAEGNGTNAVSSAGGPTGQLNASNERYPFTTTASNIIFQIMDYSATDKHKTVLIRANGAANSTVMTAGRWASTSAINQVQVLFGANFNSGTSFYLYGIVS